MECYGDTLFQWAEFIKLYHFIKRKLFDQSSSLKVLGVVIGIVNKSDFIQDLRFYLYQAILSRVGRA